MSVISVRRPRWKIVMRHVAVALLLTLPLVTDRAAAVDELPAPRPSFTYKGADLCVRCHRSEQSDWCDVATTVAWRHDAHARAHLALASDNTRTAAMEKALGIRAAETAACVACHTRPAAEPPVEEETDVLHAGISCETCHGPASGYFEPHMEKAWRFLTTAEKEAFGMHDLRNPARKAENCSGCHLGDVASGRLVSHAMYAAGHPPLPAFEVESFGRGMGPHWKRVWEKSPRVREAARAAGYRTEAADELHRSLIASLVVVREAAELVTDYVALDDEGRARPWPELSLYDCQACHHELRIPSGRQQAGYGGLVPGRPSVARWPRPLAGVAVEAAGLEHDLDAVLGPWEAAFNERPFGRPERLVSDAAGRTARERLDAAVAALLAADGDPASRREILASLVAAGRRAGDFESARLPGWVLAAAVRSEPADDPAAGRAVAAALERALALDFPVPAYPEPPARPFWETSLAAAADADLERIHAAFRLPELPAPPRRPAAPEAIELPAAEGDPAEVQRGAR
jgi:hypothetical protein